MDNLATTFPVLLATIASGLDADGQSGVAGQLRLSSVRAVTYDLEVGAGYIALEPWEPLDVTERDLIGVRYARSAGLSARYQAYLDIDGNSRVIGIELVSPPPEVVSAMLARAGA